MSAALRFGALWCLSDLTQNYFIITCHAMCRPKTRRQAAARDRTCTGCAASWCTRGPPSLATTTPTSRSAETPVGRPLEICIDPGVGILTDSSLAAVSAKRPDQNGVQEPLQKRRRPSKAT